MKDFTILDLETILQLDEPVKENLRKNFDHYSDTLKYDILSILWDGVHELKKRLAKLKYEQFLQEVNEGKRELTTNLYDQAVKAVWKDFEAMLSGEKKDLEQIEAIRTKLKLPIGVANIEQPQNSLWPENFKTQPLPVDKTTSPPPARNASHSDAGGPTQKP